MTPKEVLDRIREAYPPLTLIGDSIEDVWHYGRIERPNPESPDGEVFRVSRTERSPGGAAAVWRNLEAIFPLSTPIHRNFITAAHGDDFAEYRLCDESTGKIISPRISRHPTYPLPWPSAATYRPNVIISDYHRGLLNWTKLNALADTLRNCHVIFSPSIWTCRQTNEPGIQTSGMDARIIQDWIWVTNQAEYEVLADYFPDTHITTRGCQDIHVEWRNRAKSGAGVIPVNNIEVPHTAAIGDVFLAAFSCAHFSDVDLIDAVRFANRCCEVVLRSGWEGTHYLRAEDLEKL